jgi:ABC-type lipoprotein export system ATPase subunit
MELRNTFSDQRRARALTALERVGLADHATQLPSELSGGEQQRVAIARALVNDPPIILADEPTGNLDDVSSGELHEIVAELAEQESKTFVVVTHKREFSRFADRVLVLEGGKLHPMQA